jgi:hypothetical protein
MGSVSYPWYCPAIRGAYPLFLSPGFDSSMAKTSGAEKWIIWNLHAAAVSGDHNIAQTFERCTKLTASHCGRTIEQEQPEETEFPSSVSIISVISCSNFRTSS